MTPGPFELSKRTCHVFRVGELIPWPVFFVPDAIERVWVVPAGE